MADYSFPLNDVDYLAEDLQRWFVGRSPGILNISGSDYKITAAGGMAIKVGSGQAYLWTSSSATGGIMHWTNDETEFQVDIADQFNRYDYIAVRYTRETNTCALIYVKGNTVKPVPIRTSNIWELIVGYIFVPASIGQIKSEYITDTRLNQTFCGITVDTLSKIPTDMLNAQFSDFMTSINSKFDTQFNNQADRMTASLADFTNRFNTWFESAKNQLSGDVAGNMLLMIQALQSRVPDTTIADINHLLGSYVHCEVYKSTYGAGIGGAGEGPAGGTELTSLPCDYVMADKNHVTIKTIAGLGTVESVNKVNAHEYAVTFANSTTNLMIAINENTVKKTSVKYLETQINDLTNAIIHLGGVI